MADPLSIAASIAGLITIGTAISGAILRVINNTRSAPGNIKSLNLELICLCEVLGTLKSTLESNPSSSQPPPCVPSPELLDIILQDFEGLQEIIDEYTVGSDDGLVLQHWEQFRWGFRESEVQDLAKRIEAYKTTLTLAVTVSTISEVKQIATEVQAVRSLCQYIKDRDVACSAGSLRRITTHGISTLSLTPVATSDSTASIRTVTSYAAASFIDLYCDEVESHYSIFPMVEVSQSPGSGPSSRNTLWRTGFSFLGLVVKGSGGSQKADNHHGLTLLDPGVDADYTGRAKIQVDIVAGESNPHQLVLLNPDVDTDCTTKAEIEVDIVAVHGLNGHHTNTWTDAGTKYFWLQELSHADYLGNTARIFTFGYNATLVFNSSRALLGDIANKLLDELQGKRMDEEFEMRRPIIFICHSLGGIVVKKAFLNAHNNTEQYGTLKDSIYGITFMGTPHQGSDVADLAIKIARVADIVGTSFLSRKRFLSGLVNSLEKDSEMLQEIAENFRHHATGEHRKLVKIVSFFETKVTPPLGKVVVIKNSAVLGLAGGIETQCALDADHRAMCRFSSSDDTNFRTVYRHIRAMAEGAARSGNTAEVKEENQALSKRLHKVDYEGHLEEALAKKCENTAGWIPKSTTYQQWKKSPGHQILWLTGDVGSGKTVTTASLIEQLQGDCSTLLAPGNRPMLLYFFCDSKEKAKSDASNVLTAFLHQILARKPSYASEISKLITGADSTFPFTPGRMIKVLHRVLSKFPKIFLILDAIDECLVEKRQLLESLFGLAQYSRCLKLLVTSRPHPGPDLDPVFRAWESPSVPIVPISLTEDRVRSDIERSISQKILGFKRIANVDDDLKKRVKDTILDQAGGMFLWASLAWEMFCSSWDYEWSFEGVERRLKTLEALGRGPTTPRSHSGAPGADSERTLYGYYTAILASIPTSDRGRATRLFRWLVTAHAPLTLAELRIAYGLEGNHTCTVSLGRHLHAGNFSDEVKSLCSPFIKIVGANQIVKLVHQSVKEFFLGAGHDDLRDSNVNLADSNVNLADAELHNSIACLAYLSFKDFPRIPSSSSPACEDEGDLECTEKYPFLKYSALYWSHHTEHVQDHPLLWEAFLTWAGLEINMNLSFRIFWYSEGRGPFPVKAAPMHILCYLDLDKLVEKALSAQEANMTRDAVALC